MADLQGAGSPDQGSAQKPEGAASILDSIKDGVTNLERVTPEKAADREAEGRAVILRTQAVGLAGFYNLREKWSPYLMVLLGLTVVFQGFLIVAVGTGFLPFKDQQVFVNTVASELFLQIAGMGYVVIRCLFPSDEARRTETQAVNAKSRAEE